MTIESKCHKPSSRASGSVDILSLSEAPPGFENQISPVFNQLPLSRLERIFGSRRALLVVCKIFRPSRKIGKRDERID